jgi:hypothetical protein
MSMTCPKCHFEVQNAAAVCPQCGVRLVHNVSGVMKTSAVMIAAGSERGFYRSVQDVPEPLRTQLLEITTSQNSGTIVIADRAGKEQLTQVLARREAKDEIDGARPAQADGAPVIAAAARIPRVGWVAWAGLVFVLVLAAVIWAMFQLHW